MAEYVDKRKFIQDILDIQFTMSMCFTEQELHGMRRAQRILANLAERQPTVTTRNADEVVLCKDCTYCHSDRVGNIGCFHYKRYGTEAADIKPDDFCSYGRLSE